MTDKEIKRTIWVERCGYFTAKTEDEFRHPRPKYAVMKAQNTVKPHVGDELGDPEIEALVNDGYTVNIT